MGMIQAFVVPGSWTVSFKSVINSSQVRAVISGQYGVSKSLFAMEDEIKTTDLMLWWRVFLELGALANSAEKTADRLRRMLSQ